MTTKEVTRFLDARGITHDTEHAALRASLIHQIDTDTAPRRCEPRKVYLGQAVANLTVSQRCKLISALVKMNALDGETP